MATKIEDACQRIHKLSADVRLLGRLTEVKSTLASAAIRMMDTPQTERPFKVYQDFLCDVRRTAGWPMVVLSSASLGKDNIVRLKAELRITLVGYIARHARSLESPGLLALTTALGAPGNGDGSSRDHGQTPDSQRGELSHTYQTIAAKQLATTTQEATVDHPGHDDQTHLPTSAPNSTEGSGERAATPHSSDERPVSPQSSTTDSFEVPSKIPSNNRNNKKPRDPITVPLSLGAVEVLRDVVKGGHGEQLQIIFPDPSIQQPFILIPLEIASTIMKNCTAL